MHRIIIITAFFIILTSCSVGVEPVPQDHYYRIHDITLPAQQTPRYTDILLRPVIASGLLHERAILYVHQQRPLEVQRHYYSFWAEKPAVLTHDALYQALVSSRIASTVRREETIATPQLIIEPRLLHFERLIDGGEVTVEVELELTIKQGKNAGGWMKHYRSDIEVDSINMHDTAEAFGKALSRIAQQLVADLQAHQKINPVN